LKEASQIHVGNILLIDGELFKVLSASFSGTAKAEKQIKVSMKSIPEGKFRERVFHPDDKVDDITPEAKKAQYTYSDNENVYFMDEQAFEQFSLSKALFGERVVFLKEGQSFNIRFFNNNPIDIDFPPRVRLKVIQAPPATRNGSGVYKKVRLENDIEVDAPQFIKEDDVVEIDSETMQYIDRVKENGGKK
jgi:elongation factor P